MNTNDIREYAEKLQSYATSLEIAANLIDLGKTEDAESVLKSLHDDVKLNRILRGIKWD